MKRTATCCALAAAALFVSACSTEKKEGDTSLISHCESNQVSTGGYWWTYVDAHKVAQITPLTTLTEAFRPEPGGYEGQACRAYGKVLGPLPDSDTRKDLCGETLYPAAGMGFGFLPNNKPFNVSAYQGVVFYAKAAVEAGKTDYTLRVAVAQTSTDMAQAEYNDDFISTCLCTAQAEAVGQDKSCFANYFVNVKLNTAWQLCAVYFGEMGPPQDWGQDQGWDPAKAIKLQFDMMQPDSPTGEIPFDVWLDEVRWVIPGDATMPAGMPATSGCVPAPAPV